MSPAKVIYGRRLTDAFKFMSTTDKFSDEAVQPTWRQAWELKESANRHRFYSQREQKNKMARPLHSCPWGPNCSSKTNTVLNKARGTAGKNAGNTRRKKIMLLLLL